MIRFIPSSAAAALSDALWGLAKPSELRAESDTQQMFGWIDDLQGNRWLEVETTLEIPVHSEAVLDGIADILQPWIDSGNLPSDTNTQLASLVEGLRGQRLVVYNAFPQLFKDMSRTRAQMESLGLLPST